MDGLHSPKFVSLYGDKVKDWPKEVSLRAVSQDPLQVICDRLGGFSSKWTSLGMPSSSEDSQGSTTDQHQGNSLDSSKGVAMLRVCQDAGIVKIGARGVCTTKTSLRFWKVMRGYIREQGIARVNIYSDEIKDGRRRKWLPQTCDT